MVSAIQNKFIRSMTVLKEIKLFRKSWVTQSQHDGYLTVFRNVFFKLTKISNALVIFKFLLLEQQKEAKMSLHYAKNR